MERVGMICEYNPFHLGHEWMLRELRRQGAETIVCAMSGNFVQRGEAAVLDKVHRAEMAVRCGADLVLELPTPWSCATAEQFAWGGIDVLRQAGCTHVAFGSECGDVAALQRIADTVQSEEYEQRLRCELSGGHNFAVCRERAVAAILGEKTASLLQGANNILAVEYLKAMGQMQAVTVLRQGADHDGDVCGDIASASYIRQRLRCGDLDGALRYMPSAAGEVLRREWQGAPNDLGRCESAILYRLRQMSEQDLARYDGGGEGLYHRMYQAIRQGGAVEEILLLAKTKRYTHARLRRMLLAAWLNLPTLPQTVPYLRVLAANQAGRTVLREMKRSGAPVLTKAADVAQLGTAAEELFSREAQATDLYALAQPIVPPCGGDWRITPVML